MIHTCETCGKKYKNKISLLNHKNRNECDKYNKLQFRCENCPKRYSSKKALLKHMKDKHITKQNDEAIKCSLCNKRFSCQGNLNRHLAKGYCPMIKNNGSKISIVNNNDNSINNDNSVNINNNINIHVDFGKEKLDSWIEEIGHKKLDNCIRNVKELPCNLLEAKHVYAKQNRNIYLPSEEDKYKDLYVFLDGWKKMNTSSVLDKMLANVADDLYDIVENYKKYKLRIGKKLKDELDGVITLIQKDPYLKGPTVNMLLKNKDILNEHFNKTQ